MVSVERIVRGVLKMLLFGLPFAAMFALAYGLRVGLEIFGGYAAIVVIAEAWVYRRAIREYWRIRGKGL
jgi:hypothetical protein